LLREARQSFLQISALVFFKQKREGRFTDFLVIRDMDRAAVLGTGDRNVKHADFFRGRLFGRPAFLFVAARSFTPKTQCQHIVIFPIVKLQVIPPIGIS
jgi:hypothetical protein